MSSGPRTAYSILRRFTKTLSSVRTLPHGPVAAFAAIPRNEVMVRFCWSSAEDTGPPSVIPTPPPAPCLVIVVVIVMVLADQPPTISALRRRACDMTRIILPLPRLVTPLLPRRFPRDDAYSRLFPFLPHRSIQGNRCRESRAHHTSAVRQVTADTRRGKGGGDTHVPELPRRCEIRFKRHLGHVSRVVQIRRRLKMMTRANTNYCEKRFADLRKEKIIDSFIHLSAGNIFDLGERTQKSTHEYDNKAYGGRYLLLFHFFRYHRQYCKLIVKLQDIYKCPFYMVL